MKDILQKIYQFIEDLTTNHVKQIFDDSKKYSNIPNKIFCNAIEIENGLKMFCYGLKLNAFSQSMIILRQLIEQVSFLDVALNHPECLELLDYYSKLKLSCLKYDKDNDINIKSKYKKSEEEANKLWHDAKVKFSKIKKISRNDFLEYGWMLKFTDECGVEKLCELAHFEGLKSWRTLSNSLVHNTFSFHQYSYSEKERMIVEATYVVIALLDAYMCSYHKLTGFEFIFNNDSYRALFHHLNQEFSSRRKQLYY